MHESKKQLIIDNLKQLNSQIDWEKKLLFSEHHFSHAASAFFPSPFENATILTMDGVGEWATTSSGIGENNKIEITKEIQFPDSLGLLYSSFTYFCGFKVNSGEYKLMGLAPYGNPKYVDQIFNNLVNLKDDGSFSLNLRYFNYLSGLTMTTEKFDDLFGISPRKPESDLKQIHMDLAASIQAVTDIIVLKITRELFKEHHNSNLCLAGGVALNCVTNGKILKDGYFKNIWIQPASGDAGGAIGSALMAYYHQFRYPRKINPSGDLMGGSYLGPEYDDNDIEKQLLKLGAVYTKHTFDEIVSLASVDLIDGKAIGWFQSRMEFGPRALGNRSILADPRSKKMQSELNLKIKFRESFRPFAPAILKEKVSEWFDIQTESPYMLMVAEINDEKKIKMSDDDRKTFGIEKLNIPKSSVPAVTHVDYSSRIQTVDKNTNPKFYKLIEMFESMTDCPILVNTSFNVRGEPIVCTPEDAFQCFMGCDLDSMFIGNYYLKKTDQNKNLLKTYHDNIETD